MLLLGYVQINVMQLKVKCKNGMAQIVFVPMLVNLLTEQLSTLMLNVKPVQPILNQMLLPQVVLVMLVMNLLGMQLKQLLVE